RAGGSSARFCLFHQAARKTFVPVWSGDIQRDDVCRLALHVRNRKGGQLRRRFLAGAYLSQQHNGARLFRELAHRAAAESERSLKALQVERIHRVGIAGTVVPQRDRILRIGDRVHCSQELHARGEAGAQRTLRTRRRTNSTVTPKTTWEVIPLMRSRVLSLPTGKEMPRAGSGASWVSVSTAMPNAAPSRAVAAG